VSEKRRTAKVFLSSCGCSQKNISRVLDSYIHTYVSSRRRRRRRREYNHPGTWHSRPRGIGTPFNAMVIQELNLGNYIPIRQESLPASPMNPTLSHKPFLRGYKVILQGTGKTNCTGGIRCERCERWRCPLLQSYDSDTKRRDGLVYVCMYKQRKVVTKHLHLHHCARVVVGREEGGGRRNNRCNPPAGQRAVNDEQAAGYHMQGIYIHTYIHRMPYSGSVFVSRRTQATSRCAGPHTETAIQLGPTRDNIRSSLVLWTLRQHTRMVGQRTHVR